jgi:hypothetical protein
VERHSLAQGFHIEPLVTKELDFGDLVGGKSLRGDKDDRQRPSMT